jgi:uncharacterized lipoprotein NlpE involved in copper resistance
VKKTAYALAACLVIPLFVSCPEPPPAAVVNQTGETTGGEFRWDGVYTGVIPGADGVRVRAQIVLHFDGTYEVLYRYMGKNIRNRLFTGKFTWNEEENTVSLDTNEIPPRYLLGNKTLAQLDAGGNVITGDQAESYVLRKNTLLTVFSRMR